MKKKVYAMSAVLALTGFLGGMHPAEAAFDVGSLGTDRVCRGGRRQKRFMI